jgi:hypothetical protein
LLSSIPCEISGLAEDIVRVASLKNLTNLAGCANDRRVSLDAGCNINEEEDFEQREYCENRSC